MTSETEVVEPVLDTAIEVAQIQADRDITIAAIAAEVETARVDAIHEDHVAQLEASERESETWQELQNLKTEVANLILQVSLLVSSLSTQLPPSEEIPETPEGAVIQETATEPEEVIVSESSESPASRRPRIKFL
jgi:hypothetical protein